MIEESKSGKTSTVESPAPKPLKKRSAWLPVLVLSGVFLLGFVPMWLQSGRLEREVFVAAREARVDQIQLTFAHAALEARRGEYETARQGTARVFSLIRAELDRGIGSALPATAAPDFELLLANATT